MGWSGYSTAFSCSSGSKRSKVLQSLQYFNTESIKTRLIHANIMFMYQMFHHRIDSAQLVSMFRLNVSESRNRHTGLIHIPFGRVNTVKNSLTVRVPLLCNQFLAHTRSIECYHWSASFRREAMQYARPLGSYVG